MEGFASEGVRGLQGVKETNVVLGDSQVRLAVVSGLQNAQNLLDRIRSGDVPYDLIEVMACIGTNCYVKGSWKLLEGLAADLRRRGLSERFRIKARFCTGECAGGPNITIGQEMISGVDPNAASAFTEERLLPLLDVKRRD